MISIIYFTIRSVVLNKGLFFYDVFWVFGTDVMVTVAKNFNAPIKGNYDDCNHCNWFQPLFSVQLLHQRQRNHMQIHGYSIGYYHRLHQCYEELFSSSEILVS